ncbi:hypothetical protein TNCV_3139131 [Trichonephila clavipes]|nr:hypothetical protein TNCV_3139131 [Trichonephila clavipes]
MDEDEDKNNNESSKGPLNADAFSALETATECVRFHILHGSHSVHGNPNYRVCEWCPVPIDSDKRSTVVVLWDERLSKPCPALDSSPGPTVIDELAQEVGICHGSIHAMLSDNLKMKFSPVAAEPDVHERTTRKQKCHPQNATQCPLLVQGNPVLSSSKQK